MDSEVLPLVWMVSLDDKVTKPLQSLEKLQTKFTQGVDKLRKTNKETWGGYEKQVTESTKKTGMLSGALKKVEQALGEVWNVLKSIGGAIAAVTAAAIGMAVSMVKAAIDHRKGLLLLNQALNMTGKQMGVVAGLTDKWWATLGYTREEALQVARLGLELGILSEKSKTAAQNMRTWMNEVMLFSRATGASTLEVGRFYWQMQMVYKVGDKPIRNLGSAFKFIADETPATVDQLLRLSDTLEVMYLMTGKEKEALTKYTVEIGALEGSLMKYGIQFSKTIPALGEMLSRTSEQGLKAISNLSIYMRRSTGEIRNMLSTDPAKFVDELLGSMKRLAPATSSWGEMQRKQIADSLGISLTELMKYEKVGQGELKKFLTEATEAGGTGADKHAKAARKTVDRVTEGFAQLEKRIQKIWILLGETLLPKVESVLMPMIEKLTKWLGEHQGEFQAFVEGLVGAIEKAVKWIYDFTQASWAERIGMLVTLGTEIGSAIATAMVAMWEEVVDYTATVVIPQIVSFFLDAWDTIKDFSNQMWDEITVWAIAKANEIEAAFRKVEQGIREIINFIKTAPEQAAEAAKEAGKEAFKSLFNDKQWKNPLLVEGIGGRKSGIWSEKAVERTDTFSKQIARVVDKAVTDMAGSSPGGYVERVSNKWYVVMKRMLDSTKTSTKGVVDEFLTMTSEITKAMKDLNLTMIGDTVATYASAAFDPAQVAARTQRLKPVISMTTTYDDILHKAAAKYGVPFEYLKATAAVESGFNLKALGKELKGGARAMGLMQLLPDTAADIAKAIKWDWKGKEANYLDPQFQAEAAAYYMAQMKPKGGTWGEAQIGFSSGNRYTPGDVMSPGGAARVQQIEELAQYINPSAKAGAPRIVAEFEGAVKTADSIAVAHLNNIYMEVVKIRQKLYGGSKAPGEQSAAEKIRELKGGMA